jgi:hypothetical protein
MNWERIAFPLMIVAALVTLYLAFRRPAAAPPQTSAAPGVSYLPASYVELPPPRFDPPGSLFTGPDNHLRYPAGATAAAAIEDQTANDAGACCGC